MENSGRLGYFWWLWASILHTFGGQDKALNRAEGENLGSCWHSGTADDIDPA